MRNNTFIKRHPNKSIPKIKRQYTRLRKRSNSTIPKMIMKIFPARIKQEIDARKDRVIELFVVK